MVKPITVRNMLQQIENEGYDGPFLAFFSDGSGAVQHGEGFGRPVLGTVFTSVEQLGELLRSYAPSPLSGDLSFETITEVLRTLDKETDGAWYLKDVYIENHTDDDAYIAGVLVDGLGDDHFSFSDLEELLDIANEILGRG